MSLSPQFLDELRARTTLSTLIGRSIKVQKAGREHKACCPFHNEKTPSFTINDEKGFYHCFGCGAHGDAIKWLTDHRGLGFMDAVKELADSAGLAMPALDPRAAGQAEEADFLHRIMATAQIWFADRLLESDDAVDYVRRRGIAPEIAADFGLGWAPRTVGSLRSALGRALSIYSDARMVEAGLAIEADGRPLYERFRARLMIPIHDSRGRVIAFGGRIIGAGEPKYLNSPDTPLFDKGRTLFNLHRAGPAARKAGRLLAVEGYFDVIALAQAGIAEVVAPLGTALTESQMELMWRVVEEPILCFDGDSAGQRASARAAIRALPLLQPGRSMRFALLPAGLDPDDLVRRDGAGAMETVLAGALPLVELLWRHEAEAQSLATPDARAALRQRLVDHARTIRHRDLARDYEAEFRRRVAGLYARGRRRPEQPRPLQATDPRIDVKVMTSALRGLVRHPAVAVQFREQIALLDAPTGAQREALALLMAGVFGDTAMPNVATIDALLAGDPGDLPLPFSFLDPKADSERAAADLGAVMSVLMGGDVRYEEGEL